MLPKIAGATDDEIAARLLKILETQGIEFHLSAKVLEVRGDTLQYSTPEGGKASFTADCILNATGRSPNVKGLGLEEAGVDLRRRAFAPTNRARPMFRGCGRAEM